MSELKDHWEYENGPIVMRRKVYYKDDVDAVLAVNDNQIVELKKACNDKDEWCLHTQKELRHHKYKRCLAMAKWCESENYTACWYHENSERCKWTEKWHNRWLKIAEQFKEAK